MDRGQSLLIPPLFDGTNYAYWKVRMKIFFRLQVNKYGKLLKLAGLSQRKRQWIGMMQQSSWQISTVVP